MLEIVILGRGGQGAQTAGNQLAQAFFDSGLYVQTFSTYGGARRGTPVTSSLRVDADPIRLRCNITAADAARFGQMILHKGQYNGRQILPEAVARRILQAGNPEPFNRYYNDIWYEQIGYAYHDQWWTFNNPHKAVSAIGVHGQFIYIDPVAEMVIVKQSSHPEAESMANEVDGPLIWQAIAEHLMGQP